MISAQLSCAISMATLYSYIKNANDLNWSVITYDGYVKTVCAIGFYYGHAVHNNSVAQQTF